MSIRLTGFRACETALRDHDLKQALYDAGAVVMADVLLTLHGDEHLRRRALEMRVFRRNFLKYYEQEVFPATLDETLAPMITAGGADLIELGYRVTANLTADFAGIDRPKRSVEETEALIRLVKSFSEGATLVHSTRDRAVVEAEVRAALAEFRERFLAGSIARRQALLAQVAAGALTDDALPRDVLSVVLANEDRLELGDEVILREMAFYMQAGAHSTANATVHTFHEIITWVGGNPTRSARLDDAAFIQRCVHESLRLHPASPEAWRIAAADGPGWAAGDRVELDLFAANRDAAVFGLDAAAFDPDRATPIGVLASGLTFGLGRHTCLGRDLDGGVLRAATTGEQQRGIIALVVMRLLALGARPDTDDPPTPDVKTHRPNWGRYPVRFTA